jgi:hypothetical protein
MAGSGARAANGAGRRLGDSPKLSALALLANQGIPTPLSLASRLTLNRARSASAAEPSHQSPLRILSTTLVSAGASGVAP